MLEFLEKLLDESLRESDWDEKDAEEMSKIISSLFKAIKGAISGGIDEFITAMSLFLEAVAKKLSAWWAWLIEKLAAGLEMIENLISEHKHKQELTSLTDELRRTSLHKNAILVEVKPRKSRRKQYLKQKY